MLLRDSGCSCGGCGFLSHGGGKMVVNLPVEKLLLVYH